MDEELVVVIFALLIFAGIAVLWMAMSSRRRIREMEHRERLAMIERGLVPPPETDPGLFEQRLGLERAPEPERATRTRSMGVVMIGAGLALMVLITFAGGSPQIGFGLGGAFAILGGAFVVNASLLARHALRGEHPRPAASTESRPAQVPEPPSNIGP